MTDQTTPGESRRVTFPDDLLSPSLTLLEAAELLAGAGVRVLPVTSAPDQNGVSSVKKPGRLLGKKWQVKTSNELETVRAWFDPVARTSSSSFGGDLDPVRTCTRHVPYESLGIGIHADFLVIVDIDDPDAVPVNMWQYLDAAPFHKSADDESKRGHYFFLPPQGYYFGQTSRIKPGPGGTSAGEIRHGTAFTVTAPTAHPRASGRYHWVRVGEVRVMPTELAEWLKSEKRYVDWNGHTLEVEEADLDYFERYCEATTASSNPEILDDLSEDLRTEAYASTLHAPTIRVLIEALEYAMFGYVSGQDVVDRLGQVFVDAALDHTRGGNVRAEHEAQSEFQKCLAWALGRIRAKFNADRHALEYATKERFAYRWGGTTDEIEALLANLDVPERYSLPPQVAERNRIWYHPSERVTDDGTPLVQSDDLKLARAVLDHVGPRLLCSPRGDGNDWVLWSEAEGIWKFLKGSNQVREIVSQVLVNEVAPYTSVSLGKATGRSDPIPEDLKTALDSRYGFTSHYIKVNRTFGESYPNMSRVADTIATFSEISVTREDFDRTDTDWVPVANGMLNVRTRDFRPVSPEDLVTRRMPVPYVAGAQCPKFLNLLRSALRSDDPALTEESISLIQRFFGAALLGDWKDDAYLYVYGAAGSGKSTIFSRVPGAIFGLGLSSTTGGTGLFGTVDSMLFTTKGSRDFQIAALSGLRLVTCDEAFSGRSHIDQGFMKGFTSGEPQQCAFKTRDHFSMIPPRVVFMSNNEPTFMFTGDGEERRARFIRFDHGHSNTNPMLPKPDIDLFERDIVPELSGILNWYLEGVTEYLSGKHLSVGNALYAANKGSLSDSSPLGQFLQMFESGSGGTGEDELVFEVDDLVNLYADWIIMTKGPGASVEIVDRRQFLAQLKSDFPLARIYTREGGKDGRTWFQRPDGTRRKGHGVGNIRAREGEDLLVFRRNEYARDMLAGHGERQEVEIINDTIVMPKLEQWRVDNQTRSRGSARLYSK